MKIACLQNFAEEGPARIATWAEDRGYSMDRFLAVNAPVIELEDYDAFVIMGGPMSANDAIENPDVAFAMDRVREFMDSGKPVLGVCLGAQMMALAIGGRVVPGLQAEIGWFPVFKRERGEHLLEALPDRMTVFHWHGEQIQLPPAAKLLASSKICAVQAFQWGEQCLGLQCHVEVNEESLSGFLQAFAGEVEAGGPTVQSSMEMVEGFSTHGAAGGAVLYQVLDRWSAR
ncbi:MAG: type 1 glutamine amidotransferase [Verrucomicrobiales bacterium]|nr:type 1 glutamine amidotransferase [Verrucomicrobiales bacterium]